jgi:hypothetical protein
MIYYFGGTCTGECAKSLEPLGYVILIILLFACLFIFFIARTFYRHYNLNHPDRPLLTKKRIIAGVIVTTLLTMPFGINAWITYRGQRLTDKRYKDELACEIATYGEQINMLISGGPCDFRGRPQYKGH